MNHRRLRLPAAMALMAVAAAPVLAADGGQNDGDTPKAQFQAAAANVQSGARQIGDSVRESSQQLHDQVAHGVHQFRHEFTVKWYRTSDSIHRWWANTRSNLSGT